MPVNANSAMTSAAITPPHHVLEDGGSTASVSSTTTPATANKKIFASRMTDPVNPIIKSDDASD
jgi:hypothetical protein